MEKKKVKELISKINNGLSGSELFNNRDWYRINRLMVYYMSDEEAIMFSLLSDVENRWKSKRVNFFNKLDGYFLLTVKYVSTFLNKSSDQQRRALKKLEDRSLIHIKYWSGKKRMIKIDWDNFTKIYKGWILKYNNIDPFDEMFEHEQNEHVSHTNILNEDMLDYF